MTGPRSRPTWTIWTGRSARSRSFWAPAGGSARCIGVAIYTLNEDGETVYACALAGVALLLIVGGEILIKRFFERKKRVDNGGA